MKTHPLITIAALALVAFPAPVATQTRSVPTGAVSGVVTDAATATPLPDVLVYLSAFGRASLQRRQMTDAKGRFAFTEVPPNTAYTIAAVKPGYLDGGFLPNGGPGGQLTNITVRDDEWVQNLNIGMWCPGGIAGVVTDEQGDPVVGVLVRLLQRVRIQGRDDLAGGALTATDDRGAYRLGGLVPGRYLVQVPSVQTSMPMSVPLGPSRAPTGSLEIDDAHRLMLTRYPMPPPQSAGRSLAYPPVFYPGTSAVAQATAIDLKYGEERSGMDIRLEPVATSRVSGKVQGLAEGAGNVRLRLLPVGLESLGIGSEVGTVLSGPDGRFTFLNVPAGTYTLDGTQTTTEFTTALGGGFPSINAPSIPAPPGLGGSRMSMNVDSAPPGTQILTTSGNAASASYFGRTSVAVTSQDLSNVVLNLRRGGVMSGRVVFETDPNQPPPATFPRITVQLDPASGDPTLGIPRSSYQPDAPADEFEISGLLAGEYWLRVPGNGWLVKSVQWKGKDYTTTPFDAGATQEIGGVAVTVTNATPTLTGTVRDRDGHPAVAAAVMIFPVDRTQWRNFGLLPTRMKSAMSGVDGLFGISTLPAGEYWVVAMTARPAAWQDSAFFESAAQVATRVALTWGASVSVDVKVTTPGVVVR